MIKINIIYIYMYYENVCWTANRASIYQNALHIQMTIYSVHWCPWRINVLCSTIHWWNITYKLLCLTWRALNERKLVTNGHFQSINLPFIQHVWFHTMITPEVCYCFMLQGVTALSMHWLNFHYTEELNLICQKISILIKLHSWVIVL